MKKHFLLLLLVLVVSLTSVFALEGISFFGGIGYDLRSVKEPSNEAHSMALTVGFKTPVGSGFNVFGDLDARFVGGGKIGDETFKKGLSGYTIRAGVLYGLRFVENPNWELYFGGGFAFANTKFKKDASYSSFYNAGLTLRVSGAYRINETVAIAVNENLDLYVLNNAKAKFGIGDTISVGALVKF